MATFDDVRRIALALPESTERVGGHGHLPQWQVKNRTFAWDRPLRKGDLAHLGAAAPTGPVLGVHVADEADKQALVAEGGAYFTTPHFDGYAIVLIRLDEIDADELAEVVTDSWLVRAPVTLARAFLAERP